MKSPTRSWSLRNRLVLGVVLLTAIGFLSAGLVTQQALKSYLTSQVDQQLAAIVGGAVPRIQRGGIAHESDEMINGEVENGKQAAPPVAAPLTRIPTSTSLTLIDTKGKIVGGLGGDLSQSSISDYLGGLLPAEVISHGDQPFTIEAPGSDFRVVARSLPANAGTVVAAQSLEELDKTTSRLGLLFGLIGLLLVLATAIIGRLVVKLGLKPLEEVEITAEEIASGNLSARMPVAAPGTEVGRLVTSLNSMLGRIESSFAVRTESENKLRRFVADASHELRTPLTAIRGFSELHRQGAVTGEKETTELLGRIEGESKRMGSLVEDLLLLARLDQSREMESKPVNLTEVVASSIASASAAGPNHPITSDLASDEIFMLGDSDRIHQVIANLLANARSHTPAGTAIKVSLNSDSDGVRITVADNGPGLSDDDQKKIFERFFRADPSRKRNDGEGSGLGLSIVDAVMRAHGGTVSVKSKLGEGSAFTLFFPVTA